MMRRMHNSLDFKDRTLQERQIIDKIDPTTTINHRLFSSLNQNRKVYPNTTVTKNSRQNSSNNNNNKNRLQPFEQSQIIKLKMKQVRQLNSIFPSNIETTPQANALLTYQTFNNYLELHSGSSLQSLHELPMSHLHLNSLPTRTILQNEHSIIELIYDEIEGMAVSSTRVVHCSSIISECCEVQHKLFYLSREGVSLIDSSLNDNPQSQACQLVTIDSQLIDRLLTNSKSGLQLAPLTCTSNTIFTLQKDTQSQLTTPISIDLNTTYSSFHTLNCSFDNNQQIQNVNYLGNNLLCCWGQKQAFLIDQRTHKIVYNLGCEFEAGRQTTHIQPQGQRQFMVSRGAQLKMLDLRKRGSLLLLAANASIQKFIDWREGAQRYLALSYCSNPSLNIYLYNDM